MDVCNLAVSKPVGRSSNFRCTFGDVLFISDIANGMAVSPCIVLQTVIGYYKLCNTVVLYLFEENVY